MQGGHVSVLLSSLADFICGSRIMSYVSTLIVECDMEEAFIFITSKIDNG